MKYEDKDYSIAVWDLTFHLIDVKTDEPVMNKDGTVKEFHADDSVDCSFITEGLEIKDLKEIN